MITTIEIERHLLNCAIAGLTVEDLSRAKQSAADYGEVLRSVYGLHQAIRHT